MAGYLRISKLTTANSGSSERLKRNFRENFNYRVEIRIDFRERTACIAFRELIYTLVSILRAEYLIKARFENVRTRTPGLGAGGGQKRNWRIDKQKEKKKKIPSKV